MIQDALNNLTSIPSTDPNDARRGKLLNILLLGITVLLLVALLFMLIAALTAEDLSNAADLWQIFIASVVLQIGMVGIYFLNKYRSSRVASTIF